MKRILLLGAALFLFLLCTGCGQTFRPIIIPNPPQFPNPAAAHTVVTISDNGPAVAGSAMVIDVSGDSVVSIKNVGLNPVHAVQQTASQILVVNQSNAALPQDSVTKLIFGSTVIQSVTTITLPPSYNSPGNPATAMPNFVATTESGQAYVLMPQYQPNPGQVVPSVAVINTQQNSQVITLPVGNNPVAMAETPDGTRLYVANQGDKTISAFNTKDDSARQICVNGNCPSGSSPLPLASPPIWISARSDNQRVYVLESDGTLAYIDTTATAGPDLLYESYTNTVQAPGASLMWYDTILNRLYIPQGLQQQLTVVDVSQSLPQDQTYPGAQITTIPVVQPSDRLRSDPCSKSNVVAPLSVVAVTSLPDGTRAYIGSFYSDNDGNICPQVTVLDTTNNNIKTSIPIPGFPDATIQIPPTYYVPVCASTRFRITMAAGGDSSRAYLASCDGGNVNIVYTSTDTYAETAPAPISARNPIPPSTQAPPQNPVFMLAGP